MARWLPALSTADVPRGTVKVKKLDGTPVAFRVLNMPAAPPQPSPAAAGQGRPSNSVTTARSTRAPTRVRRRMRRPRNHSASRRAPRPAAISATNRTSA